MGLATDGDYDHLGAETTIRRPISVAQLMQREGYRPARRNRATRRALTGIAGGAVLAVGAVVGSLFLNHVPANSDGDLLASGTHSGGDIVLAEGGQQGPAGQAGTVPTQSLATVAPTTGATTTAPQNTPVTQGEQGQGQHPMTHSSGGGTITGTLTPEQTRTSSTGTSANGLSTQNRSHPTTTTQQTAPTTQSTPTTSQAPTTDPTATSAPTTTPTSDSPATGNSSTSTSTSTPTSSSPTSTSGDNGGVLGSVTGALGDVTAPVFAWFGN